MKHALKFGFSFGVTSGIITTLGLMVGLYSSTNSKLAVTGGILTIALADALSDALGIHILEESENTHSTKQIWAATISTFLTKLIFALMFIVPVFIFEHCNCVLAVGGEQCKYWPCQKKAVSYHNFKCLWIV